MRTGRERATAGLLLAVPLAAALLLAPRGAAADTITQTTYNFVADGTRTWTGEEKEATQKYKHTLDLKYRGFLQPVIENEFTIKAEWDQGDGATKYLKVSPELTLKYKGSYWTSGVKRGIEDTDEPGKNVKYADKAYIEVILAPPRPTLPDFKGKYNVTKDFEEDATNTVLHTFNFSSEYKPYEWMFVRADWTRNLTYDRLKDDSDKEDEKYTATVGIRRFVGSRMRLQTEYQIEDSRSATLLTGGGTMDSKRDQNHTWKNGFVFNYASDGTLEATYDYELKENMKEPNNHDLKRTLKTVVDQRFKILGDLALKGQFDRVESETRHRPEGDTLKTEDTWTGEAKTRPSKFFDLQFKTVWKRTTDEQFSSDAVPTQGTSFQRSLSWNCDLLPFWKPSFSVDRTDTWAWDVDKGDEVRSTTTHTYTLTGPLVLYIPAVEIAPQYTVTFTDDYLAEENGNTEVRDFTTKVSSTFMRTRNVDVRGDHTYARKEDTKAGNVVRTDTSNLSVSVKEPLPGWTLESTAGRTATDTSGDDLGADVTENFALKGDLSRGPFKLSLSYKYDRTLTEGKYDKYSIDGTTGWMGDIWDVTLTAGYKKTLSPELDQGTTVSMTFNYKL